MQINNGHDNHYIVESERKRGRERVRRPRARHTLSHACRLARSQWAGRDLQTRPAAADSVGGSQREDVASARDPLKHSLAPKQTHEHTHTRSDIRTHTQANKQTNTHTHPLTHSLAHSLTHKKRLYLDNYTAVYWIRPGHKGFCELGARNQSGRLFLFATPARSGSPPFM